MIRLLDKSVTTMVVPSGHPVCSLAITEPPCSTSLTPVLLSAVFVTSSVLVTAAMEARASPLNPNVSTASRSDAVSILLVA